MSLLPIVVIGGIGVVGYLCTQDKYMEEKRGPPKDGVRDFGTRETNFNGLKHTFFRDMHDTGIAWGIQRPTMLNVTDLNEAWKPYSAPDQTPSRSLFDLFKNEADKSAYLGKFAHPFYFMRDGEIPLSTAEQSQPNVETISKTQSFKGDPNSSLCYYPRVYVDYHNGNNPHIYSTSERRVWNAGQPTESEVLYVPREGQVNREFNPWGPGGVLQRIFNTRNERETRRKGVDRATRTVPPPSTYFNSKYR
jgi:hypothetical protein